MSRWNVDWSKYPIMNKIGHTNTFDFLYKDAGVEDVVQGLVGPPSYPDPDDSTMPAPQPCSELLYHIARHAERLQGLIDHGEKKCNDPGLGPIDYFGILDAALSVSDAELAACDCLDQAHLSTGSLRDAAKALRNEANQWQVDMACFAEHDVPSPPGDRAECVD